jgi:glutamyl-tRNA synthetase
MKKPIGEIVLLLAPYLAEAGIDAGALYRRWMADLVTIMQKRMTTLPDFVNATSYFFHSKPVDPKTDDKNTRKTLKKDNVRAVLDKFHGALSKFGDAKVGGNVPMEELAPKLESLSEGVARDMGLQMGDVAQPLRIALTGGVVSPPIGETLALIGTTTAIMRIEHLRKKLEEIKMV